MRRIYITVSESTLDRLAEVARKERREPRQQAAYILEMALAKVREAQPRMQSELNNEELTFAQ